MNEREKMEARIRELERWKLRTQSTYERAVRKVKEHEETFNGYDSEIKQLKEALNAEQQDSTERKEDTGQAKGGSKAPSRSRKSTSRTKKTN